MTLDADALVERRRLKRRVTFWRVLAVLAIAGVVAALFVRDDEGAVGETLGFGGHVARVQIGGFISDNPAQQKLLRRVAESSAVKAVVVRINSTGGSTAGGEALYTGLREIAEKKPVVAVFSTTATSAAYMAAIAADHIVARANSITGSIGVIVQWAQITELLKSAGIEFEQIKSGELKAVPSPFEAATERQREATREVLEDAFTWFVSKVEERRGLSAAALADIRSGRIYTGQQAKQLGLVDAIGSEAEAREWLSEERGIPKSLKVVDWKPESTDRISWFSLAITAIGRVTGLDLTLLLGAGDAGLKSVTLDGLVSVWQPEK